MPPVLVCGLRSLDTGMKPDSMRVIVHVQAAEANYRASGPGAGKAEERKAPFGTERPRRARSV